MSSSRDLIFPFLFGSCVWTLVRDERLGKKKKKRKVKMSRHNISNNMSADFLLSFFFAFFEPLMLLPHLPDTSTTSSKKLQNIDRHTVYFLSCCVVCRSCFQSFCEENVEVSPVQSLDNNNKR